MKEYKKISGKGKNVDFYCEGSEGPIFSSTEERLLEWEQSANKNNFFLIKDNFWTRDFPTTSSSNFLLSFESGEDSTVVELLTNDGYKVLGKTVLDELACGGTGLYSNKRKITNPGNEKHLVGGSSSGSSYAVSANIVEFAIGHDTGDSIRRPASYCGISGFKPSYGMISRYSVIPMASSLDTVGILSTNLAKIKEVFGIIAKPDYKDLVNFSTWKEEYKKEPLKKIATIKGIGEFLSKEYLKAYSAATELLESEMGYQLEEIEIPTAIRDNLQLCYLAICSSELNSHLNSLQGISYGGDHQLHSVVERRSNLLGSWVKERILVGNYFLGEKEILAKMKRLRRTIVEWIDGVFLRFDFLVFPGTGGGAPSTESFVGETGVKTLAWIDNLLLLANFAGTPSINIPIGKEQNGMPVSINIDGPRKSDSLVLELAILLKDKLSFGRS